MAPTVIPLFPLPVTLVPGEVMPLHVFEERYRQLVADCLGAEVTGGDGAFGILLVHDNRMFTTGCTATIRETTKEYGDGRLDVVAVGGRRFRVVQLIREKPYLSAAVEYFEDDSDRVDRGLRQRVMSLFGELTERAGINTSLDWLEAETNMSYRLAAAIVSEPVPKQHLLELTDENTRLDFLSQALQAILLGLAQPEAPSSRPLVVPTNPTLFLGEQ